MSVLSCGMASWSLTLTNATVAKGLQQLCETIELDFEDYHTVRTGADGRHIYMSVPAGFTAVNMLDVFPGVEFKGRGRQVLAHGCLHPETGNFYKRTEESPTVQRTAQARYRKPSYAVSRKRRAKTSSKAGSSRRTKLPSAWRC